MARKTSVFCKSRKKIVDDKIEVGNTYHTELKSQFLGEGRFEEPVF